MPSNHLLSNATTHREAVILENRDVHNIERQDNEHPPSKTVHLIKKAAMHWVQTYWISSICNLRNICVRDKETLLWPNVNWTLMPLARHLFLRIEVLGNNFLMRHTCLRLLPEDLYLDMTPRSTSAALAQRRTTNTKPVMDLIFNGQKRHNSSFVKHKTWWPFKMKRECRKRCKKIDAVNWN